MAAAEQPLQWDTLEVDDSAGQTDSSDDGYGTGTDSYATSLASSVRNYQYENGRRYHGYREGAYWGPNDEDANETWDIYHHVWQIIFGGYLYKSPIGDNPTAILDLGTGTGIWAIDMADKFPNAKVLANDLSPTQPHWVPPNLQFEVDDFTSEWTYKPNTFDLIHARELLGCIDDGPALYRQALTALKPGGWLESLESGVEFMCDDGSIPPGSELAKWGEYSLEAAAKRGKPLDTGKHTREWMEEAGFVNIQYVKGKMPCNSWPKDKKMKEIGKYFLMMLLQGSDGFIMALFTRYLGWTPMEVQIYLVKVMNMMKDRNMHGYIEWYQCIGQKPLEAE